MGDPDSNMTWFLILVFLVLLPAGYHFWERVKWNKRERERARKLIKELDRR